MSSGDASNSGDSSGGESRPPVTMIGLGIMGSALAGAFLRAGHPTTVWDRTAEKANDLVANGAKAAATAAEAVTASPIVVISVTQYSDTREVLDPLADELSGRVLVNLTNGRVEQARESAEWAAEHGIDYLDGEVLAIPPMIGQPHTQLLYAGSKDVWEANESTLKALGGDSIYLGADIRLPLLYDYGLIGMYWMTIAGFLQGLAMVELAGGKPSDFLPYATAFLEHVIGPSVAETARDVEDGEYMPELPSFNLQTTKRAIGHLVESCREAGIPPDLLTPIQDLVERQVTAGSGELSLASLIDLLRPPAPTA